MNITFDVDYEIESVKVTQNTLRNIYDELSNNIVGKVADDTILPSAESLIAEGAAQAPYFNGGSWMIHDGTDYMPSTVLVGNVTLSSEPTVDRTQYLQDKDGTIALLSDAYKIRPTIILPDGTTNVDWSIGNKFICSITRQTGFFQSNSQDGQKIMILALNKGANSTLLWENSVYWPKSIIPPIPSTHPGAAQGLLVTLRNISGKIYAESQSQEMLP